MRPFAKNEIATLVARGYLKQKSIDALVANTWTALNPTKSSDNVDLDDIRAKSTIADGGWQGVLEGLGFIIANEQSGNPNVFELARITFDDGHTNYCFVLQGQDLYDGTGEGDDTSLFYCAEITNNGIIAHEIKAEDGLFSEKLIPCSDTINDLLLALSVLALNELNDYIHQEGSLTEIGGNLSVDGTVDASGYKLNGEDFPSSGHKLTIKALDETGVGVSLVITKADGTTEEIITSLEGSAIDGALSLFPAETDVGVDIEKGEALHWDGSDATMGLVGSGSWLVEGDGSQIILLSDCELSTWNM